MIKLLMNLSKIAVLFILGLCAGVLSAQICPTTNCSTVTVQVQDSNGVYWANGSISYTFQNNGQFTGQYQWNGANVPNTYLQSTLVPLGGGGDASFQVPLSNTITPSGSSWKFTVCPNASYQCTIVNIPITIDGQNISAQINAAIPAIQIQAGVMPFAYDDAMVRVPPLNGGTYFDTTLLVPKYWNGFAWIPYATVSGVCGGTNPGPCIYGNSSTNQSINLLSGQSFSIFAGNGNLYFLTVTNPGLIFFNGTRATFNSVAFFNSSSTYSPGNNGLVLYDHTSESHNSTFLDFQTTSGDIAFQSILTGTTQSIKAFCNGTCGNADFTALGNINLATGSQVNGSNICTIASACPASGSTALAGDVTGTTGANTVVKVNNGSLPINSTYVGTNASGQIVTASNPVITGTGQSVDLAGSRSFGVVYQNTNPYMIYVTGAGTITGGAGDSSGVCLNGPTSTPTNNVYPMTYSFTVGGELAGFVCMVPAGWYYEQVMNNHISNLPAHWFEVPIN